MKITTKEPKRQPTMVIVEMTDMEACELRDFLSPYDVRKITHPAVHKFLTLIHDLTEHW